MKTTARVAASVAVLLVCATSAWAYRLNFIRGDGSPWISHDSSGWTAADIPR